MSTDILKVVSPITLSSMCFRINIIISIIYGFFRPQSVYFNRLGYLGFLIASTGDHL